MILRTGFAFLGWFALSATAAPLDALLTANSPSGAGDNWFEVSYDAVNSTLDVFRIRESDPIYGGTTVGDYTGLHLRGGVGLFDNLWVEGGLWQRKIAYRDDHESLRSAQVSMQYRFFGTRDSRSSYALRASSWVNSTSTLNKTTPTSLQGFTLDSIDVIEPSDHQLQLDLLGSWKPTRQTEISAFIGKGSSRVKVKDLTAIMTVAGCRYALAFEPNLVSGTLASSCSDPYTLESFSVTTNSNVVDRLSYTASYAQFGGMIEWHNAVWQVRGGYQYQKLHRDKVDDQIIALGGTPYTKNHIFVADVSRKIASKAAVFLRGQYMSNQFVGEIPFVYNSFTASRFDRRYGLVSFGVRFGF